MKGFFKIASMRAGDDNLRIYSVWPNNYYNKNSLYYGAGQVISYRSSGMLAN